VTLVFDDIGDIILISL